MKRASSSMAAVHEGQHSVKSFIVAFRSSHTHLAALRPPQSHRIALYRPRHPPTRWHLHRVTTTTVTATLGLACTLAHTLAEGMVISRKLRTHKPLRKSKKNATVGSWSGLTELHTHTDTHSPERTQLRQRTLTVLGAFSQIHPNLNI